MAASDHLYAWHHDGVEVVDGGCIGVFQGPRLESAAEIERARRSGCDLAPDIARFPAETRAEAEPALLQTPSRRAGIFRKL